MRLYFDFEFTGLHQHTTPISLGIVDENGRTFYAEFTDYAQNQVDIWIQDHVIAHLHSSGGSDRKPDVIGPCAKVTRVLEGWLREYGQEAKFEMWGDCLAYDWVMFCQLFGGAMLLPRYFDYIPFDLCTALKLAGHDPDVSRVEFGGRDSGWEIRRHHALEDALDIKACHERLMREGQRA